MAFIAGTPLRLWTVPPHTCYRSINLKRPTMSVTRREPSYAPGVQTLQNEGAYAVMAAAKQLETTTGKSVIHLEIGQPGFDTPSHIADAGVQAIRDGQTKYSAPPGVAPLRTAIANWARSKRNLKYAKPENVVVGPGAKPGLFFTTLALVRGPQDNVIIPDPGFPTYAAMTSVAGGTLRPVKLRQDMCSFDMVALQAAIDENTRLIVLNSPGNPTGGVMPQEDLLEVSRLACKFNCWVISDEIYSQLLYEGQYTSIAALPGMAERTVVVDGFSKSYCMTGWRLGWAIMPEHLARRVELLLVHSVGCTATFVQAAGTVALTHHSDGSEASDLGVDGMRDEFRRRRDLVVDELNKIDGVTCARPEGAFYAWADVRSFGRSSQEIADFLLRDGFVAILPGTDFGEGGEGFIRLSYVSEESVLKEGLKRIAASLQRLAAGASIIP